MLVVPPFPPEQLAGRGAVGLLVPGAGASVTRAGALAALERGKVRNSVLGGIPPGPPLIRPARRPGRITIYVSLPSPGRHHNVRRYGIAVVGGGYRGLLVSDATRIRGLVSVADVAPAAVALGRGGRPGLRSRAAADAPGELRELDRRLTSAHDARGRASLALALLLVGFALLAPRAGLLVAPAALGAALALSALGRTSAAVLTLVAATAAAFGSRLQLAGVVAAFLAAFLVILVAWPETAALAAVGPHPDGGGRFYGVTNQVETLLLAPVLAAGSVVGAWGRAALAALALVAIGWSQAGADGGGVVVLAAGFLILALRLRARRLTPRRLAAAALGALVLALARVGLDAALGGSSHVTRTVGNGPGALAGELAHRLDASYAQATSSAGKLALVLLCAATLAYIAQREPRRATVDALLVALAVSLLVNDTPTDVLGYGVLSCLALLAWERVRETGP